MKMTVLAKGPIKKSSPLRRHSERKRKPSGRTDAMKNPRLKINTELGDVPDIENIMI